MGAGGIGDGILNEEQTAELAIQQQEARERLQLAATIEIKHGSGDGKLGDTVAEIIERYYVPLSRVNQVEELRQIQGKPGNADFDNYNRGLYNGVEAAMSLLQNRVPQYRFYQPRKAPVTWHENMFGVKRKTFWFWVPGILIMGMAGAASVVRALLVLILLAIAWHKMNEVPHEDPNPEIY